MPIELMSVPIFYTKNIANGLAQLGEEEAFHCHSVLRKKAGDAAWVVDGEGLFCTGELVSVGKKSAAVRILTEERDFKKRPAPLEIAIAPTKQIERLEWFMEKAVEIGVERISLIRTRNSERTAVRHDRLEKILVAAMKQSAGAYLPELAKLVDFQSFIGKKTAHTSASPDPPKGGEGSIRSRVPPPLGGAGGAFICHCQTPDLPHLKGQLKPGEPALVLIGPEGDFAPDEVELALKNGFLPAGLGHTRLRVETAGLLACAAFSLANS